MIFIDDSMTDFIAKQNINIKITAHLTEKGILTDLKR